jgi:hypothetical protein
MGRVHRLLGDGHEGKSVHGRADHRGFAGAGGRGEDGRHKPQARDQQRDILQMEGQVWRSRLKALEDENAKPKKLLAEASLTSKVSERRACSALGTDRTSMRYRGRRPDDQAARIRLRELASVRRRLAIAGFTSCSGAKARRHRHELKLRRLYREERLQVRGRSGRKRAVGTLAPMALPQGQTGAGAWIFYRTRSPMAAVSHPGDRRRFHSRMPGAGRRYVVARPTCCSRA